MPSRQRQRRVSRIIRDIRSVAGYAGEVQHTLPNCGVSPSVPARLPSDPAPVQPSCCTCGREVGRLDVHRDAEGDEHCGECYQDNFVNCTNCRREVRVGYDYYSLGIDEPYCEDCYMSAFGHCRGCGTEAAIDDMLLGPDGFSRCATCHQSVYTQCCGCGVTVRHDEIAYVDEYDCDSYCAGCAPCEEDDDESEWDTGSRVVGVNFSKVGSSRRYGVELEISGCRKHGGLRGRTPFGAKYDGSLSSGKEFVSPVLQGDEGLEAIESLCAYAADNDWTVDSSCGYHLHIDCTEFNLTELFSVAVAYALTEDLWARFVSRKRTGNHYCERLSYKAAEMRNWNFHDVMNHTETRYKWLNWHSYNNHKTVEVRLHSGTTNRKKICNWVKIHTRFVDAVIDLTPDELYAKFEGKSVEEQFDALIELTGNDDELREFYLQRAAKHNRPLCEAVPS